VAVLLAQGLSRSQIAATLGIKVTTVYPGSVDSESHRQGDTSWKVRPEEVGEAIDALLTTRQGNLWSELEIRPLQRPPR